VFNSYKKYHPHHLGDDDDDDDDDDYETPFKDLLSFHAQFNRG